eukprot:scaffold3386_cov59-Phaeocystis_antarctica.AAC.3
MTDFLLGFCCAFDGAADGAAYSYFSTAPLSSVKISFSARAMSAAEAPPPPCASAPSSHTGWLSGTGTGVFGSLLGESCAGGDAVRFARSSSEPSMGGPAAAAAAAACAVTDVPSPKGVESSPDVPPSCLRSKLARARASFSMRLGFDRVRLRGVEAAAVSDAAARGSVEGNASVGASAGGATAPEVRGLLSRGLATEGREGRRRRVAR